MATHAYQIVTVAEQDLNRLTYVGKLVISGCGMANFRWGCPDKLKKIDKIPPLWDIVAFGFAFEMARVDFKINLGKLYQADFFESARG